MSEIDRRNFLKLVGVSAGGAAAAGCSELPEKLIPYVIQPEEITPGVPVIYASTCQECQAGCGLHVRTREGRPIKLEGNPDHPINRGTLCARGQASIERTYHPQGINTGINQGRAAGAGVPEHLHAHLVPRWHADTNFMSVVGQIRVVPDSLEGVAQQYREELRKPDLRK